ncbi:hypothetical protein MPH_04703 [Macrophomina phaseolina MS6]|uniref:Uncharacterized protein n=1 Tax=Macrophomina phaseolina (strain MS6) TaxID=1126212 RepID=K2RTE4_MACPH|nr:hypothetical protein MPH_04703 [Macrophomina phaseolina MS6]
MRSVAAIKASNQWIWLGRGHRVLNAVVVANEIVAERDLATGAEAATQSWVPPVDAAVNNGNLDACALDTSCVGLVHASQTVWAVEIDVGSSFAYCRGVHDLANTLEAVGVGEVCSNIRPLDPVDGQDLVDFRNGVQSFDVSVIGQADRHAVEEIGVVVFIAYIVDDSLLSTLATKGSLGVRATVGGWCMEADKEGVGYFLGRGMARWRRRLRTRETKCY